jgi:hypothetical protein
VLKKVLIFLTFLFFCNASNALQVEPLKILFIGNSYTQMNEMPSILQKMVDKTGVKAIIERNTQSGASFKTHSERKDMYAAIKSRNWDYIVLQGYSRELSYTPEYIDSATVPFVNKIIDSIYAKNTCTNILFFMTWGYKDGFMDREEVNTYDKMTYNIERGYRYLSSLYNIAVVPVGVVWKSVKQKSDEDLYVADRAHPSVNGSYLAACTFYNVIFGFDYNDRGLVSLVNSDFHLLIREEVHNIITENRQLYKLNEKRFILRSYISDKGMYSLTFSSHFPLANSIKWSFGDGSRSSALKGTHVFKNPGTYIVRIQVQEDCGMKIHERRVYFNKPSELEKLEKRKFRLSRKKKKT